MLLDRRSASRRELQLCDVSDLHDFEERRGESIARASRGNGFAAKKLLRGAGYGGRAGKLDQRMDCDCGWTCGAVGFRWI